jgi:RNA polymerase sigma-70 factor, ECF subfamily
MPSFDESLFAATYRRVFPMISSKCRRMLADSSEAHDLAQEVFLRLWQARDRLGDPDAMVAWLYRTCTNLVVDRARERGRFDRGTTHLAEQLSGCAPDLEAQSNDRRMLVELVRKVPARELEVAILSRLDGLTHEEIATLLGIGERTVRRCLDRFQARTADLRNEARSSTKESPS